MIKPRIASTSARARATAVAIPSPLKWPLRMTLAGMWAEMLLRAFWPLWSLAFLVIAALAFGLQDIASDRLLSLLGGAVLAGLLGAGVHAWRRYRAPGLSQALDRLDRTMPGRPIAALNDHQAVGGDDPFVRAVWEAHIARMAARLSAARAPAPDLRLAERDPYALRYAALLALVMALIFGAPTRVAELADLAAPRGGAEAALAGPGWEAWLRPPAYTGRPVIYLNEAPEGPLRVPEGSAVTVRLYGGDASGVRVEQDVADQEDATEFETMRDGRIAILGQGGREWQIIVIPDLTPIITLAGPVTREAAGQMRQAFSASDDYGIVAGRAEITLNLPAVQRQHGLAPPPEPRAPLVLDLPMPLSGSRAEFDEALVENLSDHPWANLPVQIRLVAVDARGQEGETALSDMVLPGQRFFDPLAAAIVELRRDLLWTRESAPRVAQLLRAVTHRPESFIRNERAFLQLRVVMRQLDAALAAGLTPEARDEIAAALWEVAQLIEAGDLDSARERLDRAQDRLSEAMRNGADDSEIAELMQEYREALQDYMRQLAQEQRNDPERDLADAPPESTMTGDQLQDMLEELQRLMEEGRMAEAAELLEMLRQMMENMQVVEGQGGQGEDGRNAMRDLGDMLRDQQGLNDDTYRDLQQRFGEGGEGAGGDELPDRQGALRDRLRDQGERLPGQGGREGEEARRRLDEAGRAMEQAERALREGNGAEALDRQAEAMEALREGMRSLGEALAGQEPDQGGQQSGQAGRSDPEGQRDPLGRQSGATGHLGSDDNVLEGGDIRRRADELLQELRRRSGEQDRPAHELDYLRRLLDRF
ncbi:DUF4175 domain-containing protein [Plastorhodobacter daqingensis]|uniref:DUF4175 domain-containing protein n=1 Tax=Plastorhodobacter daqingensis TaxID=1387281 RepID=A0ABW2UHS7_9RHOB